MFRPRNTVTRAASSGGGGRISMKSATTGLGTSILGGSNPRSRGSVITPLSAVAPATAGDARYTWSRSVPLRPGKFRFIVRTDGCISGGAWPMPTHGPQAGSRIRAPPTT